MSWDFETEPEFQGKLDWMNEFVREEVEPLDVLWPHDIYRRPMEPKLKSIVRPLQKEVQAQSLWACHLGPELGGQGYGQLNLALMNEILGRSAWAPTIFGCQAPDTGNAEILAHYGSEAQKQRYLQPLLDGDIVSCYSMTEPQGGADPKVFQTRAVRDGEEWVINGWKFFSSHARWASFLIVMVVTDPDVEIYRGASMFIVPAETPGIEIVRNVGLGGEPINDGAHGLVNYRDVRVPGENLLGGEGQGFAIAQTRLGGGRIHHAMRTVGMVQRCLDMLCERALSRFTQGTILADKQTVQSYIADTYAELMSFKMFVLYVAWRIDKLHDYPAVRHDIAAIKVLTPQVLQSAVQRTIQVHGALGVTNELPLAHWWQAALAMGLVDGPTEVHRVAVARQLLKRYTPAEGQWPSEWIPAKIEQAERKFSDRLEHEVSNL